MNYGKRKASKKQKEITSKATMRKKKIGVRLFKGFLFCILLFAIIGVIGGGLFIKKMIDDAPEITASSIKPQEYTTYVVADDGTTQTGEFKKAGSNRVYKSIDEIPLHLQHAFVAIEDSRFYTHNGIDPQGILRAFVVGIKNGGHFSEGASTLTQQLIKNNVFPNFVNEETFLDRLERKVQEQYLAMQVERQLSKDEILESYLNTINLGQNTLGVQAASQRYFNKDVSELTLSECATIAGITKSPSGYNPITNPEANAKRRQKVLDDMLAQEFITQEEHDEALADDVYSRIQTVNTQILEESTVTSYFNDALIDQLMEDMTSPEGLGYTETQAYNSIYGGGLTVFSTQNMTIQSICDQEYCNDSNFPATIEWGVDYALTITRATGEQENYSTGHLKKFVKNNYHQAYGDLFSSKEAGQACIEAFKASLAQEGDTYDEYVNWSPQPQSSLCIMDQSNGQIKALVGGRGEKTTNRGLNRAFKSDPRQAGSCFKILAVYAPAIDSGEKTLADVETDEPYKYSTGQSIHNWWGDSYVGPVTLRKAIEQSMNIPTVKVLQEISVQAGYDSCVDFGLTTLTDDDKVESLALGGITHGVYNYELTAAYAAIANKGVYNEPILYTKVLDHDGNVLMENNQESRAVIKETTAALLTSAMTDVVTKGTATYAKLSNMAAAGKSGTTSDNKDLWFAGYTPYYTCSIWLGYDCRKEMNGGNWYFHEKLWAKIMNRVHSELGLFYKDFTMPSSLVKKTVCSETGLLASSEFCTEITEWFVSGSVPTESCSGHSEEKKKKEEEEEQKRLEEEEQKRLEEEQNNMNNTEVPTTPEPTNPTDPGTTTPPATDPTTPQQ